MTKIVLLQMKCWVKIVLSTIITIVLLTPVNGYTGDSAKAKLINTGDLVEFDKGFSSKQKAAVLEIAQAICSGKTELVKKYTKKGTDPITIIKFWSSVDQLSNLKFSARKWEKKIILLDAGIGMSSSDLTYEGNRLVIGECTFNDGN